MYLCFGKQRLEASEHAKIQLMIYPVLDVMIDI